MPELSRYRLFCYDCLKWYDVYVEKFPDKCEKCGCEKVVDVTHTQFAIRGFPVTEYTGLSGHHQASFSSRGKFKTFTDWVPFPLKPTQTPSSIHFADIVMDGLADLEVMRITNKGFKYRITVVGPANTDGTIEFDWEARIG